MDDKFKMSQTSLKEFEKPWTCPTRWKSKWIDKEQPSEPTFAMQKGIYFETKCIGAGVQGKVIDDLPRLRDGSMSTAQKRIDVQAEKFKKLFNPEDSLFLGYEIIGVQLNIHGEDKRGTIDIVAIEIETGDIVLIDLKFTSDVNNTFGTFCWGSLHMMDFIQQDFYEHLYEEYIGTEGRNIRSELLVFDDSPRLGFKHIVLNSSKEDKQDALDRFDELAKAIEINEANDWFVNPSPKECGTCNLDCKFRINED